MRKIYDVIIIGAGSAGLAARRELATLTDNYLVIDPGPLGTVCARVGCMPSKVLIEAAKIYHQRKKFAQIGVEADLDVLTIDGAKLMNHVRRLRDHYVDSVVEDMEKWRATHFLSGTARFVNTDTVEVNGENLTAKKFIIATGSVPTVPKPWQSVEGLLTTDDVFELKTLPKSLIVIGTGAIGLELGQAFARVGVHVTNIGELKLLANLTDADVRESATRALGSEMNLIDERVKKIERTESGYRIELESENIEAERVLVAIGRSARLAGLNLGATGAVLDDNGVPKFSPTTFRIPNTKCYFVGDANKFRPVLHEAVDQGRIAALNAMAETDHEFAEKTRLSIIFTQPNIAAVGFTRAALEKAKRPFVTGDVSFKNQGRAVAKLENIGELRIYAEPASGLILGAELFAPDGEHLAHLIAWSIEAKRTVFCLLANPFYHPVLEEGLRTALKKAAHAVADGAARLRAIRCDDSPAG